ncbi:MAG: sulfurtransferase-like selenium metabolism protein YedF [bacterium]
MLIDPKLALMLKSDQIGDGEPDLGAKLMTLFLTSLLDTGRIPTKILCLGTGVFLTTQGSPVTDLLQRFAEAGAQVLSCGTCLEYYDRAEKLVVGQPTNMKETVTTLLDFQVLAP